MAQPETRRKLHELVESLQKTISRVNEGNEGTGTRARAIIVGNVKWTIETNIGDSNDDHLYVEKDGVTKVVLSGTIKTDINEESK